MSTAVEKRTDPAAAAQRAVHSVELEIGKSLPEHVPTTAKAIILAACAQISKNPKLQECTEQSIKRAVVEAGTYGLIPGMRNQCWLVPHKGEAVLYVGYEGKLIMLRRDGGVLDAYTHVVYEKDTFQLILGDSPSVDHEPFIDGDRGKIRGVYFVAYLKDVDRPRIEWMNREDIERVREVSSSKNGGKETPAWRDWPDEQSRKSVIHRASKTLPCSPDTMRLFEMQAAAEYGTFAAEAQPAIEMPRRLSELPVPTSSPGRSAATTADVATGAESSDSMVGPGDSVSSPSEVGTNGEGPGSAGSSGLSLDKFAGIFRKDLEAYLDERFGDGAAQYLADYKGNEMDLMAETKTFLDKQKSK